MPDAPHASPPDDRGRHADRPMQLGRRGWLDTFKRVKGEIRKDNLAIVAAGVAFYAFLALVPAMAALISLWGLFADPAGVEAQLSLLSGLLPPNAYELIAEQMRRIAGGSSSALGLGLALSLVLSLWSARQGINAIVTATNIAYDEEETRGFFELTALTLGFTLGAIVMVLIVVGAVVALPLVLGAVGLGRASETLIHVLRWPLLAAIVVGALIVLYRWSPDRADPKWRWVVPGALLATIGWLAVSLGFSFYVSNFGSYGETYGTLGGIVVLLLWFYLSAFVVLLGAELNAEAEAQTTRDSTVEPDQPMGERRARKADELGRSPA